MAKIINNSKAFDNVEKVDIVIPKDRLNEKDAFVPVAINGYIWKIKRGEKVSVPAEVERILREAGYIA